MTAAELLARARAKGVRITAAESCTGGMIMAALTDIPGSSDVVDRGFVTYSNAAKLEMLGVKRDTLETHGAVSEAVAAEMAQGALARSAAQIAIAVTGIAGPGSSGHKPEGRVCFGLATLGDTQTRTIEFGPRGRTEVRAATVAEALDMIAETLAATP